MVRVPLVLGQGVLLAPVNVVEPSAIIGDRLFDMVPGKTLLKLIFRYFQISHHWACCNQLVSDVGHFCS